MCGNSKQLENKTTNAKEPIPNNNDKLHNKNKKTANKEPKMKQEYLKDGIMQIEGKLRLVGASRNARLIISTDDELDFYLIFKDNNEKDTFMKLQGKRIKINGELQIKTKTTADDKYTIIENELTINKYEIVS